MNLVNKLICIFLDWQLTHLYSEILLSERLVTFVIACPVFKMVLCLIILASNLVITQSRDKVKKKKKSAQHLLMLRGTKDNIGKHGHTQGYSKTHFSLT